MNKREKIVLATLYLLKKVWGRTYLQKFIYLLNREVFKDELFEYKYYKYGPYSSEINESITILENSNLVEESAEETKGLKTAYTYKLTTHGEKIASKIFHTELTVKERDKLMNYATEFKNHSPTELLLHVYQKYPEVTENSIYGKS